MKDGSSRSTLRKVVIGAGASAVLALVAVCSDGGSSSDGNNGGSGATGGDSSQGGAGAGIGVAAGGSGGNAVNGGSTGSGGAGVGGSGGTPSATCNGEVPKLKLTRVIPAREGAPSPLYVTQPIANEPIYVVEKPGHIRLIKAGAMVETPFADLTKSALTSGNDERGLLGLAFHPKYQSNGRFFVYYTRESQDLYSRGEAGDIVIAEGARSKANPEVADAAVTALVVIPHREHNNHNGGMISFGPDNFLYAGTGDGGGGGDPDKNGQKLASKLAKILRIDVDNVNRAPPGNFEGADPHVWAIGLRNPWRWSFDRATGDMYIGDVGQELWEEVSVIPKGAKNPNLGWSVMEGNHCYADDNCDKTNMIKPATEYSHADGESITGGYVYRGKAIPCLAGRYLYADYETNRIWSFVLENGQAKRPTELTADLKTKETPLGGITTFGEDADGELFVADIIGNIYRIQAE